MSWSAAFLAALEGPTVQLVYAVETFTGATGAALGTPGAVYTSVPLAVGLPWLVVQDLQLGTMSIMPRTWQYQEGAWAFTLAQSDRVTVAATLRRGTWVVLRAGLPGWVYGDYQPIAIGRVARVSATSVVACRVEVWGLTNALRNRFDTVNTRLCYNAGTTTTTTTAYQPAITNTLDLTSVAGFEIPRSGGTGAIRLVGNSGAEFYLTYTGITGLQLTGVSLAGVFGSTAEISASGNIATALGYYDEHPCDSLYRALVSTGAGTNGPADTMVKSQSWAVPHQHLDRPGFIAVRDSVIVPASGSWLQDLIVDAEISDGVGWLQWLSDLGAWLCLRQGQITIRAAQSMTGSLWHSGIHIAASEVLEAEVEWYDPQAPVEGQSFSVHSTGGMSSTSGAATSTLPSRLGAGVDLYGRVNSNETAIREEVRDRLYPWESRVPERLVLRCRGARLSQCTVGDVVTLDLDTGMGADRQMIGGGLQSTIYGYDGREAMVGALTPGLVSGVTVLDLLVLPLDTADSWGV